jgi:hypothetical protein
MAFLPIPLFLLILERYIRSCSSYFDSISVEMVSNSDLANLGKDLNNNGLFDSLA